MPRLALLAVLLAGTAFAGTETVITTEQLPDGTEKRSVEYRNVAPTPPDLSFESADQNHDGAIDRQEAHDQGILNFDRADLNRDGRLDDEEYQHALTGE
jgi:hypothetical protein